MVIEDMVRAYRISLMRSRKGSGSPTQDEREQGAMRAAIEALADSDITPKMAETILGHGVDGWSGNPMPEYMQRAQQRWSASLRAALSEDKGA